MPERAIFLERRSYRMRRVMDVVRLWPLVGLALWMVPLLWPLPSGPTDPMPMSVALRYLFGVWLILISGAGALWWVTRRGETVDDADPAAPQDT